MTKIAYLLGIKGAGKSHLAKQVSDRAHWIEIDRIQHLAGRKLFAPAQSQLIWQWEAWDAAFEHADCQAAILHALHNQHGKALSDGRPILAEGMIIAWTPWRSFFIAALSELGVKLSAQEFFWLDPAPEQILTQIKQRARPNEPPFDLARVQMLKERYEPIAAQTPATKFSDTPKLAQALEAYLFE